MKWIKSFLLLFCIIGCYFSCCAQRTDTEKLMRKTGRFVKFLQHHSDTIYVFNYSSNVDRVWYHKNNICHLYTITTHKIKKQKFANIWSIFIDESIKYQYFCHSFSQELPPCFVLQLDGCVLELYIKGEDKIIGFINPECLFSNAYEAKSFESYVIQILKKVIQLK